MTPIIAIIQPRLHADAYSGSAFSITIGLRYDDTVTETESSDRRSVADVTTAAVAPTRRDCYYRHAATRKLGLPLSGLSAAYTTHTSHQHHRSCTAGLLTLLRLWDDSCSPFGGCIRTTRALWRENRTVKATNAILLVYFAANRWPVGS